MLRLHLEVPNHQKKKKKKKNSPPRCNCAPNSPQGHFGEPPLPTGGRVAVYAIDFGEELSGLSGALLERESRFVQAAARHLARTFTGAKFKARRTQTYIRELAAGLGVSDADRAARFSEGGAGLRAAEALFLKRGLVLFGHSMGGIVSTHAAARLGVATVVTVSAPHARPPVPADAALSAFYAEIADGWRRQR
jgi:hypothetical protein